MTAGGVCPVCEIAHHANDGLAPPAPEKPAGTFTGRLWQSGRLALIAAVVLLGLATVAPLLNLQRADHLAPRVAKSTLALITADGLYGHEVKSTTLIAVPGAAFFLLTFVWSRRTRPVAVASRPLLLVTSLLPLMGAALLVLKIAKHHRFDYSFGPGFVLIVFGTAMGILAATQFGTGMPEPRRRFGRDEDEDDDE